MSTNNPDTLRNYLSAHGKHPDDLTVLTEMNDPFRQGTPARHRDGAWLADCIAALRLVGPRHLRGLHYILVSAEVTKPNGQPYTNTKRNWNWLLYVAKAARWLEYVPFDQIIDERNAPPETITWAQATLDTSVSMHIDTKLVMPSASGLEPTPRLIGYDTTDHTGAPLPVQPHHLVIVGEKSSLRGILGDVAHRYSAALFLPNGEISDTQIYRMAADAAADGRPMEVFYFSDADPSGWQMPISVAHKLQAFQVLDFDDLDFRVYRVALTPDQVRQYGLPSTPMSANERRADAWTHEMHVEQTEVDALAALQPDLLRQLAEDALAPFHDAGLPRRIRQARHQWEADARQAIRERGGDELEQLHADTAARVAELHDQAEAILADYQAAIDDMDVDLPPIPDLPEPELSGERPVPLCDSRWDFREQCRRLKASKAYDTNGIA